MSVSDIFLSQIPDSLCLLELWVSQQYTGKISICESSLLSEAWSLLNSLLNDGYTAGQKGCYIN